ncbi:hypothetical protein HGRIS_006709 [Hohenbuehelia grisea]|uniref:NADP-dependent oxidoreductase domain-containing protein n=1 Tax=Hohenbuehelia grisea TaxID=104357 RepID=A0ABR3JAD2_9AGAR
MSPIPNLTLNNGIKFPAIGHGSWSGTTPDKQAESLEWLKSALKAGYRHIDTAQDYQTEKYVGIAIRESGIPREEIFVTTKLPWNHHTRVAKSFQDSLEFLGIDYIDLYLMHWPQAVLYDENNSQPTNPDGSLITTDHSFNDTWADIEKLLDTGKVRAIGVSNLSIKNLERLLKTAKVVPAVNQVELHPYLAQNDLLQFCQEKGIILTAYAATGYSYVRDDPLMVQLGKKYDVSPTQVTLAWHLARGTTAVPKSTNFERQKQNLTVRRLFNDSGRP